MTNVEVDTTTRRLTVHPADLGVPIGGTRTQNARGTCIALSSGWPWPPGTNPSASLGGSDAASTPHAGAALPSWLQPAYAIAIAVTSRIRGGVSCDGGALSAEAWTAGGAALSVLNFYRSARQPFVVKS